MKLNKLFDKAKDAAAAIKEPGAAGNDRSEAAGDGGSPQQP